MTEYADADYDGMQFVCVCGHCANHDNKRGVLEINFVDMIMYYRCSKCKKTNKLDFSMIKAAPYPKSVFRS